MDDRTREQQSKHDKKVTQIAHAYRRQGWEVYADIQGCPQPQLIGGHRPDVIAVAGRKVCIVEVETEDSRHGMEAQSQLEAFKAFAAMRPGTEVHLEIA